MNEFPVDNDRFMADVTAFYGIAPVVDRETGEHRRDKDGLPKWKVRLIVESVDMAGRPRRPEFVEVGVACWENELDRSAGDWPTFTDLTVREWRMDNRSGVSLSARSVTFGPPPAAAVAA